MGGTQFEKECDRCHKPILMVKEGGGWKAQNRDYTPHHCTPAAQPATEKKPDEPDSLIGIYQGITFKRINILRKDKRILSSETTPDLLKTLSDPACTIKVGMKVKIIFAPNGAADKIEICPDQPEQLPEQKTADQPAPAEPHVPADAAPAPAAKPPQTFTPGDLFSPKDRLIVAQCLVKAYTDLWMQTHTPDTVTFADARSEILAAVKADLLQVMEAGVR